VNASFLLLLLPEFLAGQTCATAIEAQLTDWGATAEVLKSPGGPQGGDVYRIATGERGVWLTYHQPSDLPSGSVFRTDPYETVRLDFQADCAVRRTVSTRTPVPGAFTDEDLSTLVERHGRLVVYLWSPHLPLSVDGYHEIKAAAEAESFAFVAVVDAGASRSLTRTVGAAQGVPEDARRPLGAVELLFRDIAVHSPSILVFADGQASAPLPGYRNRDAYRRHLANIGERTSP